MRRSEMRRLAQALHKDFGKHDWHASELVDQDAFGDGPDGRDTERLTNDSAPRRFCTMQ
jgi:hypothetical protein